MTYLKETLDEICRRFCPMSEECDINRLCENMVNVRNMIINIMTEGINDN